MHAVSASFFKPVANIPRSSCLVVGGVMSGALYLGGVMTVNLFDYSRKVMNNHAGTTLTRPTETMFSHIHARQIFFVGRAVPGT